MTEAKRPNFIVIVADDLGFSDVGCFGSEIQTPNLDQMAKEGLTFTDFHSAATCSPTRAMLFSGTDSHLSGLGAMAEGRAGATHTWSRPGYEGYINFDVATLPEVLSDGGYYTMLSGKWHLGFKPECNPHNRGFQRSLALLPGQTNHWAFHPELQEYNGFLARMPILHTENGTRKIYPTNTANEYSQGFYSTNKYTDTLIQYLEERTPEERAKPFFAALTFAAPHWPLQCSKEDREKYKGMYDDGPSALREKRIARMKSLNIVDPDIEPHPVINEISGGKSYIQWEQMTPEQQAKSARAMETYAGMVDNIDQNIGKLLRYLEQSGLSDDTLVCFMSDNGAEGAAIEARAELGDLMDVANRYYNNKFENIGNYDSFVWYGPRWAQASTAPHKLYKGFSTEGGIRVPFIMKYPKECKPERMVRGFSTVMDIAPTILELAGVTHPVPAGRATGTYRGRQIYGMRGMSWVKGLRSDDRDADVEAFHGDDYSVGWELGGRAALRKGKWKITYLPVNMFGKGRFELYDIVADPGEIHDLSKTHQKVYKELLMEWEKYVEETKTYWPPPQKKGGQAGQTPEKPPIEKRAPVDSIGGDPIEQCTAWMDVGEGEVARPTLPSYSHIPQVA